MQVGSLKQEVPRGVPLADELEAEASSPWGWQTLSLHPCGGADGGAATAASA